MIAIALALLMLGTALAIGQAAPTSGSAPTPPACQTKEKLPTPICHVFVIYLENQNASKVLKMPFEGHYLVPHYAYANNFYSVMHFSFPNYLAATAAFATNYQHVMPRSNVVNLLQNHTPVLTWDAYMQGMPSPCYQSPSSEYRTAHNPFVWYADIWDNQTYCKAHDVTFGPWTTAVAHNNVPDYAFFAPNVTNDCWKLGVKSCDAWLKNWLTPLVNDTFFQNSVFMITYDESTTNDTGSANGTAGGGGHIYTVAVSPFACKGFRSQNPYNGYSIMTTTEWLLGLGRLGYQDNWTNNPPMKDLFCFPANSTTGGPVGGILATSGLPPSEIVGAIAIARPMEFVALAR